MVETVKEPTEKSERIAELKKGLAAVAGMRALAKGNPSERKKDGRYSITREWTGHASGKPQHVVRFLDKPITDKTGKQTAYHETMEGAKAARDKHMADRWRDISGSDTEKAEQDYSHHLPQEAKAAGYKIRIDSKDSHTPGKPTWIMATAHGPKGDTVAKFHGALTGGGAGRFAQKNAEEAGKGHPRGIGGALHEAVKEHVGKMGGKFEEGNMGWTSQPVGKAEATGQPQNPYVRMASDASKHADSMSAWANANPSTRNHMRAAQAHIDAKNAHSAAYVQSGFPEFEYSGQPHSEKAAEHRRLASGGQPAQKSEQPLAVLARGVVSAMALRLLVKAEDIGKSEPLDKARKQETLGTTRSGKTVYGPTSAHVGAEQKFMGAVKSYGHHHPEIDRTMAEEAKYL
jgi:hypothetical protein